MILHGITIPNDLHWLDEWAWTPAVVEQGYATDGTQILERGPDRQAGRPVTLDGKQHRCAWFTRAELEAVQATLTQNEMQLTLWDGRTLTVGWRHEDTPIDAEELWPGAGKFLVTLRLRTV